jgi:predicted homoserine dehydrogenase-like protein
VITIEEAVKEIQKTVRVVLLVSGRMGSMLVPKVHHMPNVMSIIVFCMNVEGHKLWADNFLKVKEVTKDFTKAMELCKEQVNSKMLGY